jgi:hypothetical protein
MITNELSVVKRGEGNREETDENQFFPRNDMVVCLWEELAQLEIELEFYVTLPILVQCEK